MVGWIVYCASNQKKTPPPHTHTSPRLFLVNPKWTLCEKISSGISFPKHINICRQECNKPFSPWDQPNTWMGLKWWPHKHGDLNTMKNGENGASSFKKEALLLVARFGKRIHGEKRMDRRLLGSAWWVHGGGTVDGWNLANQFIVGTLCQYQKGHVTLLHIPCGDFRIDTSPKTVRHGKFREVIIHGALYHLVTGWAVER